MPDQSINGTIAQSDEELKATVVRMTVFRDAAEAAATAAESARQKADSESAFAFNAKGNAEEHAGAIAKLREPRKRT